MSRAAGRPLYGVDAGGSGTSVRACDGASWTAPSVNPSSVGQQAAQRHLSELFSQIRAHADQLGQRTGQSRADHSRNRPAIWLASASVEPGTAEAQAPRLVAVAATAGLHGELVISNDLTPLLLVGPAQAGHVIAVCGTGSGFLATDGRSAPVRIGSCEYLGSDEGSAFDLGLRGLRAAVRGLDGRAARTVLSDLLAAQAGMPVHELARGLAAAPFPKSVVAALAPVVTRAWLGGDPVAARLAEDALGELVLGVRAARDAAALAPGWRLSMAGGVLTGCPEFSRRLAAAVRRLGTGPVELISDPAAAVLAALAALAGTDPIRLSDPRIDRAAWHVDLAGPYAASPAERAG